MDKDFRDKCDFLPDEKIPALVLATKEEYSLLNPTIFGQYNFFSLDVGYIL